MNQSTPKKKETNSAKTETNPKTDSNKSSENSAKEAHNTKTSPANKSASQSSISHFSSVSTPEYREGWNRIFGHQEKGKELSSNKNSHPTKLSISNSEISPQNQIIIREIVKQHALKQGIDAKIVEEIITRPFSLEYNILEI